MFTPAAGTPNASATTTFALSDASSAYGTPGYASIPTVLTALDGDEAQPNTSLAADAAGDLFGTDLHGGANSDGGVFEIVKTSSGYASTATILVSFNRSDGSTPYGDLVVDAFGDLFGTASAGGANGDGEVLEIAKTSSGYAATPTVLATFDGSNGSGPAAGLVMRFLRRLFWNDGVRGRKWGRRSLRDRQDKFRLRLDADGVGVIQWK